MVGFGLSSLLLLAGATGLANGGIPHGPGVVRYPRGMRGVLRARDTTYTTSTRDPTANRNFGTAGQVTTVNAGVTQWLSGLGTHNFYGNVNNYGSIIISQTDYLSSHSAGGQTSDYVGHTTTDGNLYTGPGSSISLNDYGSASAPTYDWYLHTMQNYGALQMCGRGDTGGSTYQLYCDLTCYNYGVIDMEQYYNNIGASFVWRNANLYPPGATNIQYTYNYGAFRIVNVVYHNVQNVLGDGCYVIGSNAVLYLEDGSGYYQNPNFGPTFPNQTITFTDGTGDLHMDTQVYSHNSNFGPQVYGFGQGNAIEFYEIFPSSNIFTYSTTTGILTVRLNSGNSVNIKLGTGYDPTLFTTGKNPSKYNTGGYNAVFYNGATPSQTVPTACSVSVATCADPAQTAGATSTSATYVTTTIQYTGPGTIGSTFTSTISLTGTAPGTVEVISK